MIRKYPLKRGVTMNFRDSWTMSKACFRVLWEEKILVVFPLISMMATGLILMVLFGGLLIVSLATDLMGGSGFVVFLVFSFFYFFLLYIVAIFSNVAIVGCARIKLEGGKPTFKDGWKAASDRLGAIITWALLAATIGVLLQIIRSAGKIGEIAANLLGLAWNILTYFVVPVIAYENVGPFKAIGRSKDILRRTWGEALVSNISVGLIFFLVSLPILLLLGFLFIATVSTGMLVPALLILGIFVLFIIILWAVHTALKAILMTALYRYATTGVAGLGIPDDTVRVMFTQKKKGIRRLF